MKISIVTTLYESAGYIQEFHRRATAAAASVTDDYEILMVNDGSPDDSMAKALELLADDPHLRIVELSRNFGHHKAMMTGLDHADGDFVFLIDVDLEEDPAWLPRFWEQLSKTTADVVYGYQDRRKGRPLERLGGALHWWMIRHLSSYPIPRNMVTARLMSRQYVRSLVLHKEQNTAIGGLWAMTGYRQVGVAVVKGFRDRTSYSFAKRLAMVFDGITAFSERPLVLIFGMGVAIFGASCCVGAFLIWRYLSGGPGLPGWASVMVSVWILGGLSVAAIGVVGLYTARVFVETKRRPYSIVRRIHTHELEANRR